MKKNILSIVILLISLFMFVNIDEVKAAKESKIQEKVSKNGGITCKYNFTKVDTIKEDPMEVRCYFYKSKKTNKKFNKHMCYFGDGKLYYAAINWKSNGNHALTKDVKEDYSVENYVNKQKKCPTYAIAKFSGSAYEIFLFTSETKYEHFIRETKLSSTVWNRTGKEASFKEEEKKEEVPEQLLSGCDIIGQGKIYNRLKWIINIIRIAAPLLVIILGISSFVGAVFSGEEKSVNEAKDKFIKRLVAAIVLILIPFIIKFLADITGILFDLGINADDIFCKLI